MKLLLPFIFIFFSSAWAFDEDKVSVEVLAKSTKSWDGTALPSYGSGAPEVTILRIKIPPKVTLPWHKHPIINAGLMLKGELKVVTKEGEILHLKPGDTIIEVVDKWHYGVNEGEEAVEIVVVYAGVVNEPLSISEQ
jgi:quercetin dioxygenase-like cupin family protein